MLQHFPPVVLVAPQDGLRESRACDVDRSVESAGATPKGNRDIKHEPVLFKTKVVRLEGSRTHCNIHFRSTALVSSPRLKGKCVLYRVNHVTLLEDLHQRSPENRLMGVVLEHRLKICQCLIPGHNLCCILRCTAHQARSFHRGSRGSVKKSPYTAR